MVRTESQKDREAEDLYRDRRIRESIYCAKCGYNLRTLPRDYICPECGNPFKIRGISREGVFWRNPVYPPISSFVASTVFGVLSVVLLVPALRPLDRGRVALGLVFAGITAGFVVASFKGFRKYLQHRIIERQIAEEESE